MKVKVEFFLKPNKRAGPNKGKKEFFSKINKRADPNKSVQGGKFFSN